MIGVTRGLSLIFTFLANLILIECEQENLVCSAHWVLETETKSVHYNGFLPNGNKSEYDSFELVDTLKLKISDTCKPDCNPRCRNARCVEIENNLKCVCHEGYELSNSFECVAQCNLLCGRNTKCTTPGKCDCKKGYKRSKDNSTNCEPICSMSCEPGRTCSAPNTCTCKTGYKENELGFCQPLCETIKCKNNEICEQPEVCKCALNYDNSTGTCKPQCNGGCGPHEICSEPDECKCDEGYKKKLNGSCDPYCGPQCGEHSECISPGECACKTGYVFEDNRCSPNCDNKCGENSTCIMPGKCECSSGFQANDEHSHNCSPPSPPIRLGTILISSVGLIAVVCITLIAAFVFSRRYKAAHYTTQEDPVIIKRECFSVGYVNEAVNVTDDLHM